MNNNITKEQMEEIAHFLSNNMAKITEIVNHFKGNEKFEKNTVVDKILIAIDILKNNTPLDEVELS